MKKKVLAWMLALCAMFSFALPGGLVLAAPGDRVSIGLAPAVPAVFGQAYKVPVTVTGTAPTKVELYNYYTTKAGTVVSQLVTSSAAAPFDLVFKPTRESYKLGVKATYADGSEVQDAKRVSLTTINPGITFLTNDFDKKITNMSASNIPALSGGGNYSLWSGSTTDYAYAMPMMGNTNGILSYNPANLKKSNTGALSITADLMVQGAGNTNASLHVVFYNTTDMQPYFIPDNRDSTRVGFDPVLFGDDGTLTIIGNPGDAPAYSPGVRYHVEVFMDTADCSGKIGIQAEDGSLSYTGDFSFDLGGPDGRDPTTLASRSNFEMYFFRFHQTKGSSNAGDIFLIDNVSLKGYGKITDQTPLLEADLPYVRLTDPAPYSHVDLNWPLTLRADVSPTVARVDYYNGNTLLGTASTAPYGLTLVSAAAGTYSVTAKAYDAGGRLIAQTAEALPFAADVWLYTVKADCNDLVLSNINSDAYNLPYYGASYHWGEGTWPWGYLYPGNTADKGLLARSSTAGNNWSFKTKATDYADAAKVMISFDFKMDDVLFSKGWDSAAGYIAIGSNSGTGDDAGKLRVLSMSGPSRTFAVMYPEVNVIYTYQCVYDWQAETYHLVILEKETGKVCLRFSDTFANCGWTKPTTGDFKLRWVQNSYPSAPAWPGAVNTVLDNIKIAYTKKPSVTGVTAAADNVTVRFDVNVTGESANPKSNFVLTNTGTGDTVEYASVTSDQAGTPHYGKTFTLALSEPLEADTTYRVTFSSALSGVPGQQAPANEYVEFTTGPPADEFLVDSLIYQVNGQSAISLSGVRAGDDIKIYPKVVNGTGTGQTDAALVVAVYSGGALTNVGVKDLTVAAGGTVFGYHDAVSFVSGADLAAGDSVAVYVWDGLSTMTPILQTPYLEEIR